MSSAPSPLSLSDFLTSPPPLDLASLPPSGSLLSRYSTTAAQEREGGSTTTGGTGTPPGGRDEHDFLDFTLSPEDNGGHGLQGGDGMESEYGLNGEGMFGIHHQLALQQQQQHQPQRQPSSSSTGPSHSVPASNGQQQQQQQQPFTDLNLDYPASGSQPDLRALLESLGTHDGNPADNPAAYLQVLQHPLTQMSNLHSQQGFSGGNGLLDLLPQLQGFIQSGQNGAGGQGQVGFGGLNQAPLQQGQQGGAGLGQTPDVASLLALIGVPGFGSVEQGQNLFSSGSIGQGQTHPQGQDAASATLAKLRELQDMQQAQAALIQQQLNQIAAFYQANGQGPSPQALNGAHSGSTTSSTSPSSASIREGNHGPSGGYSQNGHSTPGESPHLGAQGSFQPKSGYEGTNGMGLGGIAPLPTPNQSGELNAVQFSPHQSMMNAGGGGHSVYMPGSSSYKAGGPSGWRNTGENYDRDGNLLLTPLISPAMTAISHPTPGSAFQHMNPALSQASPHEFFSPLTSPALGPSQFERGMNLHSNPHPGLGTMSPHLLAQRSTPGSPLINGSMGPAGSSSTAGGGRSHSRGTSRSARGAGAAPDGGKASSSRSKTRPSPIIKPVNSNGGQARKRSIVGIISTGLGGPNGLASPKALMSPGASSSSSGQQQQTMDFQGLPASAIPMEISRSFTSNHSPSSASPSSATSGQAFYPNGGAYNGQLPGSSTTQAYAGGTDSSPSPIDFALMPPPPMPGQQQQANPNGAGTGGGGQNVAPQTPATFLNLSHQPVDQRAIYSEGNTVSSANGNGSAGLSTNLDGGVHAGVIQTSYAAMRESMGHPPADLSSAYPIPSALLNPNGAVGATSAWQGQKQGVRMVERSPLGSPALGPADFGLQGGDESQKASGLDKGKGKEMLPPVGKGKKATAKAAAATTGPAKRGVKGAKPPVAGSTSPVKPESKKTSHKAAEQKRRDSLKAGFDELRLLLPPINVELVDPDTGLPIAGASMPRLPARNLDTGEPNRNVSKVALLRCSNKHLKVLNDRISRREEWIGRLVDNIRQLRSVTGLEGVFEGDDMLFDYDVDGIEREEEDGPSRSGREDDDGMEDDETRGLRKMSDEQEEGLDPVEEEGSEHDNAIESASTLTTSLARKKSLTKGAPPVARRMSTGRAAAMVASDKIKAAEDDGMDES